MCFLCVMRFCVVFAGFLEEIFAIAGARVGRERGVGCPARLRGGRGRQHQGGSGPALERSHDATRGMITAFNKPSTLIMELPVSEPQRWSKVGLRLRRCWALHILDERGRRVG